jgi:SAM-dependent methyltransferase
VQRNSDLNVDLVTVEGFGAEWTAFDQTNLSGEDFVKYFDGYFSLFPFEKLPQSAEGFDLGCGSGRWAAGVAAKVGFLHCIDPSIEALEVARRRLAECKNVAFHLATANDLPLRDGSQDFGYSLGVLHHVPDTQAALTASVAKLKPGAPFLLYLYYSMDNRPAWFRRLWRLSDVGRRMISRLPFWARRRVTDLIAVFLYWPLARIARLAELAGKNIEKFPLSFYRSASLYTMRTDSLDRFGTRLEKRFSRIEVEAMMKSSGLTDIVFREAEPYWTACGRRAALSS